MKRILSTLGITLLAIATMAQVPNYVPTNGLVGYWPFDGNAIDESGNGNDGAVIGTVLTEDRFGNLNSAYTFGNGNYIQVPYISALDNINDITISLWVKIAGLNSNTNCSLGCAQMLVNRGPDNLFSNFHVRYHQQNGPFHFQTQNDS